MKELSLDEIKDHRRFENLVAAYFENLNKLADMPITQIRVDLTGVGPDGGRDLLVHTTTEDILSLFFKRTWVVQCKFHEANISTNKIADVNYPLPKGKGASRVITPTNVWRLISIFV
jgi:predicted helicase